MTGQRTYKIGEAFLYVDHETRYARTTFADGTFVEARPQDDAAYRLTARELGYGEDTWSLCWQHEAAHSWLCERVGLPWSPTLFAVAHGETFERASAEEAAVLEFQRELTLYRRLRAAVGGVGRVDDGTPQLENLISTAVFSRWQR